nr:aldehyde dehydrogenase family protein [Streptomyces sp. 846.5]
MHADIYDEVARRYGDAVKRLCVGNGADPGTHIGPMVSAAQRKRVLDYIDIGVKEGRCHDRSAGAAPRRPGAGRRLLRRADAVHRGPPGHAHRPGGDLRTGHLDEPVPR